MNELEKENRRLRAENTRLRKKLGYKFMLKPVWSEHNDVRSAFTMEEDNEQLVIMNKIYEESNSVQEANEKIDRLIPIA